MNLPPSASDASSFDKLHPEVQRWIWDNRWTELRDIQSQAIQCLLGNDSDVILAATTAAGKTEAAFLPILSQIASLRCESFSVFYISPLKALINDQFRRLESLCESLDLPVIKWHGDASAAEKERAQKNPRGIVLITPESLESLLVRRGPHVRRLVQDMKYIVIDELHAFLGSERGVHLASLMKRLDAQVGRSIRKVGLSATIGDFAEAKRFLNPVSPDDVNLIHSTVGNPELKLQVRGYREPDPNWENKKPETDRLSSAKSRMVGHIHDVLRGKKNLIFGSSRKVVEYVADALLQLSEQRKVPNEFFPHHGSLSKTLREDLESRLKDGELPTSAVATTTLELGIDIGSVSSVAQIGPPASIASLRQRIGRSGRRAGEASVLRIYVEEPDRPREDNSFERLRLGIVQSIAAINLLLAQWIEPGSNSGQHFSTLLHQTLAVIRERGGARADELFALLCGPGPFAQVSKGEYVTILKAMKDTSPSLIEQSPDGLIMLGRLGEIITDRFDFYAVFMADEEFRIVSDQKTLGTLPILNPLREGDYVIFAGRRWIVLGVDDRAKVVTVEAAPAGRIPIFPPQEGHPLHDRLVAEMRSIYQTDTTYSFLDTTAKVLLQEGREAYRALELNAQRLLNIGDTVFMFLWRGTMATETMKLALAMHDIRTKTCSIGLMAEHCERQKFEIALSRIFESPPSAHELALFAQPLRRQKYDEYLPDTLLQGSFARSQVDQHFLSSLRAIPAPST